MSHNTAKLWGNEQVRNLVEIKKQLGELTEVPWEIKKFVRDSKKLGKVVMPALLKENENRVERPR